MGLPGEDESYRTSGTVRDRNSPVEKGERRVPFGGVLRRGVSDKRKLFVRKGGGVNFDPPPMPSYLRKKKKGGGLEKKEEEAL